MTDARIVIAPPADPDDVVRWAETTLELEPGEPLELEAWQVAFLQLAPSMAPRRRQQHGQRHGRTLALAQSLAAQMLLGTGRIAIVTASPAGAAHLLELTRRAIADLARALELERPLVDRVEQRLRAATSTEGRLTI